MRAWELNAAGFHDPAASSFDLSKLNKRELRRLLNASRERGQAGAAYKILQEMAARRDGGGRGLFQSRDAKPPRMVDLDFGDPLERREEPPSRRWGAGGIEFPGAFPEPEDAAEGGEAFVILPESGPLSEDADEAPRSHAPLYLGAAAGAAEKRRGYRLHLGAAFTVGAALGAAVTWELGEHRPEPTSPPSVAAAPARPAAAPAVLLPLPREPVEPEPKPLVAEFKSEPKLPVQADTLEVSPFRAYREPEAAPIRAAEAVAPPPPVPEKASDASLKAAPDRACARAPTPADRAICRSPQLQQLQRKLRQAYAEALEAHEDRSLLRRRQLAWRDSRDGVSEPGRLAMIYKDRIRKLNAATREARRS